MSSPTVLRNVFRRSGFRVIEWSERSRVPKRNSFEVPRKHGVYALYFGNTMQHIGSTFRGLRGRIGNQRNAQENYKPHESFSWFALPESQVHRAEAILIEKYKPHHSKRKSFVQSRRAKGRWREIHNDSYNLVDQVELSKAPANAGQ